jgi:hypothetical protein
LTSHEYHLIWKLTYCDMSTSCWVAQRSVARQPSAKQLATEYKLRGGEGRRSLLRAAAMTSRNSVGIRLLRAAAMTLHGSTLVSKVTPVNTVT